MVQEDQRRLTFEKLPLPIANSRLSKYCHQAIVKLPKGLNHGFLRTSHQVGRNSLFAAFELPLMEETQARWLICLFLSGHHSADGSAMLVSKAHEQLHSEMACGVFQTASDIRIDDIPGDSYNEQVTQPLVEHNFWRNPRIRASRNCREWFLFVGNFRTPFPA